MWECIIYMTRDCATARRLISRLCRRLINIEVCNKRRRVSGFSLYMCGKKLGKYIKCGSMARRGDIICACMNERSNCFAALTSFRACACELLLIW